MSKLIINCEQRSEEWHKCRLGVLTASACESIMAPAKRKDFINKKIVEILTGETEAFEPNKYILWGIEKEDEARDRYILETGREVQQVGFIYKDEDRKVGCSPDGLIGKSGLIEIKCPSSKVHLSYIIEDKPPTNYYYQMQFQMWVCGKIWCDFVSYDPRMPKDLQIYIIRVMRDPDVIRKIENSVDSVIRSITEFLDDYNQVWHTYEGA
jgi:putative phage-type endonuclease